MKQLGGAGQVPTVSHDRTPSGPPERHTCRRVAVAVVSSSLVRLIVMDARQSYIMNRLVRYIRRRQQKSSRVGVNVDVGWSLFLFLLFL